jgi:hypothetical protein
MKDFKVPVRIWTLSSEGQVVWNEWPQPITHGRPTSVWFLTYHTLSLYFFLIFTFWYNKSKVVTNTYLQHIYYVANTKNETLHQWRFLFAYLRISDFRHSHKNTSSLASVQENRDMWLVGNEVRNNTPLQLLIQYYTAKNRNWNKNLNLRVLQKFGFPFIKKDQFKFWLFETIWKG